MAATLQRESSGGVLCVMIAKAITKNVPRICFVVISARMVVGVWST